MRKSYGVSFILLVGLGFWGSGANAQFKNGSQPTELNLPRLSQRASVTQRIGLTDVTIVYHEPLVNGRPIWDKQVPYGKVWRAGANENTTILFSDDVSVEGHPLPAGTYGLHTIPGADQWTIIFSKNSTSWGSFSYDEKEDALRVNVKPQPAEMREALTYTFQEIKPDSAAATLQWEKIAVPFHIAVDVKGQVLRSIKNQLRNVGGFTWAGYDEAANWLLDNNYELDQALKWCDESVQGEERFENLETKSRVLDAMGRKQEAAATLSQALDKANAIQYYVYARSQQRQGQADKAYDLYKTGAKKYPNHWISHVGLARVYSHTGDFTNAAKEMKLSADGAPEQQKPFLVALQKRLEAKDDINK